MATPCMEEQQQAPEEQQGQQEQREKPAGEPESGSQPPAAVEAGEEANPSPVPPPELLATQVMASVADLSATQVTAPMDQDSLATQVVRPVQAPMQEDKQVEFQEPAERKQVKRPKSAFWLFQGEIRGQASEELGPGAGAARVASLMAAKWKELDEAAKAKFVESAKELKAQYDKDIADGAVPAVSAKKAKAAGAAKKKAGAAGKKKKAGRALQNLRRRAGPKKPKGSYSIWLGEHRKEVLAKLVAAGAAEPSFEEISRAAGKTWLALTAEEKAPYLERAKQLAAKFKDINKACKEYKKANAKDSRAKAGKKQAAAKAKKQAKAAGKAKKPAADKAAKQKPESKAEGGPSGPKATPKKTKGQHKAEGAGAKAQETPQKRAAGAAGPTPKKAKKAVAAPATAYLDMAVLAEAEKAGLGGTFRRLAEREDMKPYAQRALLDALAANGGLLHRAKDAVLAGQA